MSSIPKYTVPDDDVNLRAKLAATGILLGTTYENVSVEDENERFVKSMKSLPFIYPSFKTPLAVLLVFATNEMFLFA